MWAFEIFLSAVRVEMMVVNALAFESAKEGLVNSEYSLVHNANLLLHPS